MARSILIVDDDARVRTSLEEALAGRSTEVRVAGDADQALRVAGQVPIDLVITDVRMPGTDGLGLLRLLRSRMPDTAVVLMTAYEALPTVVDAMREGAEDFLVKPLDLHVLRRVVERIFEDRETRAAASSREDAPRDDHPTMVGRDPGMIEIFKTVGQVAATRVTVLIRGESGTGKELIARALHAGSRDATEPFVAVNCAALPSELLESELFGHVKGAFTGATSDRRGRFAMAGRGTVFLDEIGDTSPGFQSKLLRVLQEHEYHPVGADRAERTAARIIAATHGDLEAMVSAGSFREDLYYRLKVLEIAVPPLRDRPSDVAPLAEHLVRKASSALGRPPPVLAPDALEALRRYRWPGNVRELENCLTRALVLATGGVVRTEHLALGSPWTGSARLVSLDAVEREHVAQVLGATGGNKSRAAQILEVSRPRLDRLITRHGLQPLAPGRATNPDDRQGAP